MKKRKHSAIISALVLGLASASAFAQTAPAADSEGKKSMEFKVSGQAEFDTYARWKNDSKQDLYHRFWSTVDVDFMVKFNDQWSAQVEIEADAGESSPYLHYNGAFVQYRKNENLAFKLGDMTYSEGAFNYYDYDDPAINAAGMAEHDVRGIELDFYGLQFALGFTRNACDYLCGQQLENMDGTPIVCAGYDIHAAYQFNFAGQKLRPFVHYHNWQHGTQNEFHAGLDAALEFGPFALHAVYGLHKDDIGKTWPRSTHAFLAEPSFKMANVSLKAGLFYAWFEKDLELDATIHGSEIPEYLFAYGEGDYKLNDMFTVGLLCEFHTNSINLYTDLGSLNFGSRLYVTPVEGLDITTFATAILPLGHDWEKQGHEKNVSTENYGEDVNLKFGVEAVFKF